MSASPAVYVHRRQYTERDKQLWQALRTHFGSTQDERHSKRAYCQRDVTKKDKAYATRLRGLARHRQHACRVWFTKPVKRGRPHPRRNDDCYALCRRQRKREIGGIALNVHHAPRYSASTMRVMITRCKTSIPLSLLNHLNQSVSVQAPIIGCCHVLNCAKCSDLLPLITNINLWSVVNHLKVLSTACNRLF